MMMMINKQCDKNDDKIVYTPNVCVCVRVCAFFEDTKRGKKALLY